MKKKNIFLVNKYKLLLKNNNCFILFNLLDLNIYNIKKKKYVYNLFQIRNKFFNKLFKNNLIYNLSYMFYINNLSLFIKYLYFFKFKLDFSVYLLIINKKYLFINFLYRNKYFLINYKNSFYNLLNLKKYLFLNLINYKNKYI